jgi:trk system potassium uptake protein TrkA
MKDQVLIIGLGQFGMSLARTLCDKGFQVIAVDMDQKLVNEASNFATDAICLNTIDEASLSKLSPKDRDIIICAIGAREPSILTVAILKQMGCKNVIARASETIHARILKAIGADHVINPEYEYGKKFANKILLKSMFYENAELSLLEFPVKSFSFDKNNIEIILPDNLKLIPQEGENRILISGSKEDIEKMIEENK